MSPQRITARNRANARKSTGPRTSEGKAIVAANARRHGATARADPDSIAAWLALILNKPGIEPQDMMPEDDFSYRALALAEAEARLAVAERALIDFEVAIEERNEALAGSTQEALSIAGQMLSGKLDPTQVQLALRFLTHKAEHDKEQRKQDRLLKRYLAEARSKRRKAFAAWLDIRQRKPEVA